jgi:hypothetical protein
MQHASMILSRHPLHTRCWKMLVVGKHTHRGFSRYHQVRIIEEDHDKTKFTIEWGSFTYKFMPFGLTDSPIVFSE